MSKLKQLPKNSVLVCTLYTTSGEYECFMPRYAIENLPRWKAFLRKEQIGEKTVRATKFTSIENEYLGGWFRLRSSSSWREVETEEELERYLDEIYDKAAGYSVEQVAEEDL